MLRKVNAVRDEGGGGKNVGMKRNEERNKGKRGRKGESEEQRIKDEK